MYRPDEYAFMACVLDEDLKPQSPAVNLGISNCADPRLVWLPDGRLLMIYSSYDTGDFRTECIRGAVILDLSRSAGFLTPVEPFRVSPPSGAREKNWMPFLAQGKVYLVASVRPHVVYELPAIGALARPVAETAWLSPWFTGELLRGNTNPVQLDDGTFLGTFHSVQRAGAMHYYDNGCYVFEGTAPFRVLRCARRTYLPAEAAVEPHYRKAGAIQVCFPVGLVREGERLLVSYGDNDSAVKILETTVADLRATTLSVYPA